MKMEVTEVKLLLHEIMLFERDMLQRKAQSFQYIV
jgi:hypothetical protein